MYKLIPIFLIALLSACTDRTPPVPENQNVRPAKMMTVESQSELTEFEFTARIEALQTVDVSFEVGGPLAELNVREGETVPQNATIAALDATDFQLDVREAELQLRLAAQDLNRKQQVLAENGIAKSQVEDAQSHYELQRVRLRQAKERLADTKLIAPFEAYVSQRYFDQHVNVQPGQPIVKLHDLSQLQVVMSIPETLVATANPEQLIRSWVEFSFAPGQQFDVTVYENRGEADALAQTYEVSFVMPRPETLNILPGMTAAAKLQVRSTDDATILLPAAAVVPAVDGSLSVWVYDPTSQTVSRRAIETEAPTESGVPVISGLVDGEQVVIAGASQLQQGMKVRPLNE